MKRAVSPALGGLVPASRSRTERWFDCLQQVAQRDGAIEISIPASAEASQTSDRAFNPHGADLIWRVRILSLSDTEIIVEQPSAAGQFIPLNPGVCVIGAMSIGQNRWMFRTHVLPPATAPRPGILGARQVRLAMPETVERCQRRNFYRISTAELSLPTVECWPLINPTTVVSAEVANRALIMDLINGSQAARTAIANPEDESLTLPEVGPRFNAHLMNLGGGGAGLLVDKNESSAADRARLYWVRINLMPMIPAPIAMTARLVHTHIDSAQNLYAGLAFEWSFHLAHRDFVVDQITRYVAQLQKQQARAA